MFLQSLSAILQTKVLYQYWRLTYKCCGTQTIHLRPCSQFRSGLCGFRTDTCSGCRSCRCQASSRVRRTCSAAFSSAAHCTRLSKLLWSSRSSFCGSGSSGRCKQRFSQQSLLSRLQRLLLPLAYTFQTLCWLCAHT